MKNLTSILILFLVVFSTNDLSAQNHFCATDKYYVEELKNNPAYRASREQHEQEIREYIKNNPSPKQKTSGAPIYTIPVVFHVIHNYGYENIPKSKILTEVEYLNKSFQNLWADTTSVNPPFKSIIADSQIEFKLAQIDPNGNCTDGITRTVSSLTFDAHNNVKSLVKWPYSKYLNVWVVANISTPGVAGFAYYPGANNPNDGIVIRYDFVGASSNYDQRVLTHEVGHWLDLPHTWGGTNDPGIAINCSNDDFVQDTPNTIGVSNFSCNYSQVTCNTLDNVENYMDYAGCSYMFTNGQKDRMHMALNNNAGSRNNLNTPANLIATGTEPNHVFTACEPIADFKQSTIYLCTGQSTTFNDLSWRGDPTSWQWDLPGGSPSMSNDPNPVVQYNTPGVYNVTLTVSNAGGSNSTTATGLVVVSPSTAANAVPFTEDFENVTIPSSSDWFIENEAGNDWQHSNAAAFSGTKAMRLINHSGNPSGTKDAFVTPGYNLTNIINANMTFQLAFAARSTSASDQLKVYASKDCGQNWAVRYTKSGINLASAGLVIASFIPSNANQWDLETVNIGTSSYNNQPTVRFKFEYTHDSGNNIYIDDINITGTSTVGIQDVEFLATLNVFPNPSSGTAVTSFSLSESNDVKVDIIDITGRVVETVIDRTISPGMHEYTIGEELPSGSYFVRYSVGDNNITRKFVKM